MRRLLPLTILAASAICLPRDLLAQNSPRRAEWLTDSRRAASLKSEAVRKVDSMRTLTQQMVDQIFSFGELGFQETETSRYLADLLKQHGFTVEMPYAGIPTAFVARWGGRGGRRARRAAPRDEFGRHRRRACGLRRERGCRIAR